MESSTPGSQWDPEEVQTYSGGDCSAWIQKAVAFKEKTKSDLNLRMVSSVVAGVLVASALSPT